MSKIPDSQPLVPSILDRLLDDDPGAEREPAQTRHQVLRELRMSVRRDLENLLNTRRRFPPAPATLTELAKSMVGYGLPDFTGASGRAGDPREEFRRILLEMIRRFEPRFKKVDVQLLPSNELERTLRFRIDALLHADPAPEPIVFDTSLDETTGGFAVKGDGG